MKIVSAPGHLDTYRAYLKLKDVTHGFLREKNYLPLEVPLLAPALVPESYLEVFETEYRYFDTREKLYLTPSPEMFMKRFLAQEKVDCYYFGQAFRNHEATSDRHSSEFTMLEYYKIGATYLDLADELLALLRALSTVSQPVVVSGKPVAFDEWEMMTVDESFVRYAGLEKGGVFDELKLRAHASLRGYVVDGFSYEDIFSQLYVDLVEPNLGMNGRPTLLYDYPHEFAALAKLNHDGKTAARFEFYIGGVELGDCYSELTDAKKQRARFQEEQAKRTSFNRISHPVDWGFIDALDQGLPECAGIAIGFERLAMVFLGHGSIHDLRVIDVV
jgi:elongation factor P--beta-lysine ligase